LLKKDGESGVRRSGVRSQESGVRSQESGVRRKKKEERRIFSLTTDN
jgi:hypothetical protein